MSATLTVHDVSKTFGSEPAVLTNVSLSIAAGSFLAIRGQPNSGRSTMLRCLAGAYRSNSGTVAMTVDDETVDLATADARTLVWIRQHHLSFFDRALSASPSQDAAAAVARAARVSRESAVAALGKLGLGAVADVPLGRLRPSQRRAVALVAALRAPSALLVMDEPDVAADPDLVAAWIDEHLAGGTAIVAAIRPGSPLEATATAVADLHEGKIQWARQ